LKLAASSVRYPLFTFGSTYLQLTQSFCRVSPPAELSSSLVGFFAQFVKKASKVVHELATNFGATLILLDWPMII